MELFLLTKPEATERWGRALGARLRSGDVIALMGDLGSGKTTLTQAIARGLGITHPVTSPTFTLLHEYPGPTPLFHCDPYRLDTPDALASFGFEEYLEREGVLVVEWADKVEPLLPDERLTLLLGLPAPEEPPDLRLLRAQPSGARYTALLHELVALPEIADLRLEKAA
jgi:tRNA threonylcarbamoyladenosine biosynthesis protein TsaE